MLLAHRAGTLRDGDTAHWENDAFPDAVSLRATASRTDIVRNFRNRFKYSNYGFALLGQVVEAVSGVSYDEYVAKNILAPLGMRATYTDIASNLPSMALGYSRHTPFETQKALPNPPTVSYAPATGFVSNVQDLAKYFRAFARSSPLLSTSSIRLMTTPLSRISEEKGKYSLGLRTWDIGRNKLIGHSGNFAGFSTRIAYDQKKDLGVIVLTNTNSDCAGSLCIGIYEALLTIEAASKKMRRVVATRYASYEGLYRDRWRDTVIATVGDRLMVLDPQGSSPAKKMYELKARSEDTFTIMDNDVFGMPGEIARFADIRDGKAQTLWWGPAPSYRVT